MTEQPSNYDGLEKMDTLELLTNINHEDKGVPLVMEKAIPQIKEFVDHAVTKMKKGGRLFYIGAGTSGRLGVLDASECPPTFGVSDDWIIGLIAGGDKALRKAVENAEDDFDQAWKDLQAFNISEKDIVLGIAASGTTPYVIGGIRKSKEHSILTGSIACNAHAPLSKLSDHPIELVVGAGICHRQHTDESRDGTKACLEHDFHLHYDSTGQGSWKQDGGYAIVQ